MRIHALILARDEEHNLAECIGSLRGCADDITVFDTGSRDATMARAQALGAACIALPWSDDFAAVRNAAFAQLAGDWVLVMDADERFADADRTRLRALLHQASASTSALHVEIRSYTSDVEALGYQGAAPTGEWDANLHGYVPEMQPRLLRPLRGLRWHGRVCESLCTADGVPVPLVAPVAAVVQHHREAQTTERREQRERLRLRLALQEWLENADAAAAGRLGALLNQQRRFHAALPYLRAAARGGAASPALHLQTGVAQFAIGLVEGATSSLRLAWQELHGHPEIAAHLARALLRGERPEAWAEAGELLEAALDQAPELDLAVHQRAVWHRKRHEFGESRAYLQTLLDRHPGHPTALRELGVVALLQGQMGEAERSLQQACRQRPEDAEAWNNLGCVLERRGLWKAAHAAFARAVRLAPGEGNLLRNLCLAEAECGDHAALRQHATAMLAASSQPESALRQLRERLLDAGWIDALRDLETWAVGTRWLSEENCILTPEEPRAIR
ncbi:MAG TPA: tetratricopeptide repeat protein [Candidatus Krumholzibacteria bacterium]|nr:tetratricopeptide repeat protein [Candidatus Krumholzibacteria bacterium]